MYKRQAQCQWANGLMVQETCRRQGVSHAVLETCFISDKDDMNWYQKNKSKIATGIVAGIQEGFHLNYATTFSPYMVKVDVSTIPDHVLNIRELSLIHI